MRKIILGIIRIYQKTLSLDQGLLSHFVSERFCRFHPTCSQYAYESINRFGVLKGSWIGFKRVIRCHPWNGGGYDPIPEKAKSQKLKVECFCDSRRSKFRDDIP